MRILIAGKSNRNGYTLIELVAVVVLISIFISVAVPKLRETLFSSGLKSSVRRLTSKIAQLRADAVRKHTEYWLHLDLESNSYWESTSPEVIDEEPKDIEKLSPGVDFVDVVFPSDEVTMMVGRTKIYFSPRGYVEETRIHLRDQADTVYTLLLQPFLPQVKIENDYVE
jgi:prepilin-type N-terminal cleavage/methylation domain-containing protein